MAPGCEMFRNFEAHRGEWARIFRKYSTRFLYATDMTLPRDIEFLNTSAQLVLRFIETFEKIKSTRHIGFLLNDVSIFASGGYFILFAEISLKKTGKSSAVASLILCHLMNGVVNSVKICSLCSLCKVELALGCAVLGSNSHFEVLLC